MKLRALLVLLVLAACDDAQQVAGPPPREPGPTDVGNYCGMVLVEHPGPKAQIFLTSRADPLWFTQVRDAIAFTRLPEEPRDITAIWVNDMGRATDWQAPEAGAWTDARSAWFVIAQQPGRRHGRLGGGAVRDRAACAGVRGGAWWPRRAPGRDPGRLRPGMDPAAGRRTPAEPQQHPRPASAS